jgi:hypothetical protein
VQYLVGQRQRGEGGYALGPLDAHEQEARRRLAHGLRGDLVEVEGRAADLVGVLGNKRSLIKFN